MRRFGRNLWILINAIQRMLTLRIINFFLNLLKTRLLIKSANKMYFGGTKLVEEKKCMYVRGQMHSLVILSIWYRTYRQKDSRFDFYYILMNLIFFFNKLVLVSLLTWCIIMRRHSSYEMSSYLFSLHNSQTTFCVYMQKYKRPEGRYICDLCRKRHTLRPKWCKNHHATMQIRIHFSGKIGNYVVWWVHILDVWWVSSVQVTSKDMRGWIFYRKKFKTK